MLYDAMQIVETELESRGCPMPIIYGPERSQDVSLVRSRIVFERPRESGDEVSPPRQMQKNPPRRAERGLACVCRVFAHSTLDGARVQDHEALADQTIDLVVVALQIAAARLSTTMRIGAGGFVDYDVETMTAPGVVYELEFTIQRGVFDRTWADEARAENADFTIQTAGTCVMTVEPED